MTEIRWHGRGGLGAFTAARLLGCAVSLFEGKYALAFPSFGPERRGAPVFAFTRIDDKAITDRSEVVSCDCAVVLDDTLFGDPVKKGLKPGATVIINTTKDKSQFAIDGVQVEVPAGSFYGDVKAHSTSVDADLLSGGKMTVKRSADGEYTISGVLVGDLSLKRYFTYTGKLTTIDRHGSTEEIPNSTLNADLTLNEWAQARLQDKADFYYLQDESCRVLELYLAEEGVGLAETWPTGNGRVLKVEFFVEWATDVTQGIPAGTYKVVARDEESKGILREFLKPGGIASGYPNVFTYPAGTWYEKISNGTMKEYARIDAGTMTVVRDGDKHTLTIDFIDCDKAHPHHVRSTFSQDTPINVFGYHP